MGFSRGKSVGVVASLILAVTTVVSAQTTRPIPRGMYENQPISQGGTTALTQPPTTQQSLSISTSGQLDMGRVALALGLVISMILGMRWAGKRFFPSVGVPRSTGAMKVLSRLLISPKQQLLMIQVGRRIVIVGDSSGQMSSISEITDGEEVAALMGQLTDEKSQSSMKAFGALFHREEEKFEEKPAALDDPRLVADSPSAQDPAVESAREEIDDLADKIRHLSAQFGGK
jgi:flagellar biogenesis protein FliO